jgi:hypothetical protein
VEPIDDATVNHAPLGVALGNARMCSSRPNLAKTESNR